MPSGSIVPCGSCGRATTTDSQFCPSCGTPQNLVAMVPVRPVRNAMVGGVTLAAGALLAVGAFLPWQVVKIPGADPEQVAVRGWEASSDAMIFVGLALLAAVCAGILFSVADRLPLVLVKIGLAVIGVIGVAVAVLDILDVRGQGDPAFTIEVGFGLYVAAASAFALVVISALAEWRADHETPEVQATATV